MASGVFCDTAAWFLGFQSKHGPSAVDRSCLGSKNAVFMVAENARLLSPAAYNDVGLVTVEPVT